MVVQGRRPAVFAADDAGEVAEMVGCCRDVDGFVPGWLAVVQGFDEGQRVGVLIDDVGDFQEDGLSFSGRYVFQAGKAAWAARTAALTSSCVASAQTDRTSPLAG